jgi:hypothetical protein
VYYLKSTDPEYLHSLRHLAYKHAVAFSGCACGVSMVQVDAQKRAESVEEIKKWVDVTEELGASHLRIFAGVLPEGANIKDAVDWVVEAMKAACDYSGKKGITLGVEDHEGVTQNADLCIEIMQRVNSPHAFRTPPIFIFATIFTITVRWIWTAYGRSLRKPGTRDLCRRSMNLTILAACHPRPECRNWLAIFRRCVRNTPAFERC